MIKAVVLLSGGLDSTTVLYYARARKYTCHALIFNYGQRHSRELVSAVAIAKKTHCPYHVISFKLPWQGSSLLNRTAPVPSHRAATIGSAIPSTYVPARNTLFLAFAVSYAETIHADTIFIGANAVDFSGYPDCRPEYYRVFNNLIREGTKAGATGKKITIKAPLMRKTKKDIIQTGRRLNVPYEYTWSCYKGGRKPCMICDACKLRSKGFISAGMEDPLLR